MEYKLNAKEQSIINTYVQDITHLRNLLAVKEQAVKDIITLAMNTRGLDDTYALDLKTSEFKQKEV